MSGGSMTFRRDPRTQLAQLGGSNKLKQERNRAYLFIGLLLFVIGGMASAITVLANIHAVIPVVSVMDANGHVVKQQVVNKETIIGQESFVQSQLYDFITYCNTFDPAWRQRSADLCRLHSTPGIGRVDLAPNVVPVRHARAAHPAAIRRPLKPSSPYSWSKYAAPAANPKPATTPPMRKG